MDNLNAVVVGVDFSAGSGAALAQAVRIAAWGRAAVHAVYAADLPLSFMPEPSFFPEAVLALNSDVVGDAKRNWETFETGLPGRGGVTFHAAIASPVSELARVASEVRAGLVVVGSNSLGGAGAGPVAAGCVRHARTPVLLVRGGQRGPFVRVLACVDFSPASLKAVAAAARVATQDQARLNILHVFRAPWRGRSLKANNPLASGDFQEQYRSALIRHTTQFIDPLRHELTFLKPSIDVLEDEHYGPAVARWAAWVRADLVVLGTRGKTNLRDMLIGSTAERVLREARCSVLAVPPGSD